MGLSARILLTLLVGVIAGLTSSGVASAREPAGTGKYYVVGPPVNGQREYLYQIAAATLGDGNRYREIFDLNKGRRQPDGGRLTDPTELRSGWVLVLPADAKGAAVRSGAAPEASSHAGEGYLLAGGGLAVLVLALALRMLTRARKPPPRPPIRGNELRTEVDSAAGRLVVRLTGPPASGVTQPYTWLVAREQPSAMALPVEIGQSDGWRLWIDLAGTPDVFTLTSAPQAQAIGDQLSAQGHVVAVVGQALGPDVPQSWVSLPAFPTNPADLPAGTGVVISTGLRGAELAFARHVAVHSGRRFVPIVVGQVLRARWSATIAGAGVELPPRLLRRWAGRARRSGARSQGGRR
jgi:hypothetical protein